MVLEKARALLVNQWFINLVFRSYALQQRKLFLKGSRARLTWPLGNPNVLLMSIAKSRYKNGQTKQEKAD